MLKGLPTFINPKAKTWFGSDMCLIDFHETLDFRAGQYLTLTLILNGQPISRSYSLCNLSNEPVQLLIKRLANGAFSRTLLDAPLGSLPISFSGPSGKFYLPENPKTHIVFIAAGSGIAPVRPLLRAYLQRYSDKSATLLYATHTKFEAPFYEEFLELEREGRLDFRTFFSNDIPPNRLSGSTFLTSLEALPLKETHFMLCAPPAMLRSLTFILRSLHVPADQIILEQFQASAPPEPTRQLSVESLATWIKNKETKHFTIHQGEYVLSAALRQGVAFPYSCKGGVCGSCVQRLLKGQVKMSRNEFLSPDELERGYILTCTALCQTSEIILTPL